MIATRPTIRLAAPSFLAVAAVLAAVAIVPGGARAQCATVTAGFTVIGFECTGLDPDGIAVGRPGVIGEVGAGARVEGGDAIALGERATVIVEGEVEAEDTGIAGGDRLTVLNDGRVAGGTAGVGAGDFLVLRNALGAAVEGGEVGVAAGEDPQIVNSGTIGGIRGEEFVTVRNDASGTIGGIESSFNVTLDNAGVVEGGIRAAFDTAVVNRSTGVIRGGIGGGPSLNIIFNDGLIDGAIAAGQGLDVGNTGTLLGGISASDEPIDVDNSGLIRTEGSAVFGVRGAEPRVVNSGEIVAGVDAVAGDLTAGLENTGTITAGDDGVDAAFGVGVVNSGTITAGDDGIVSEAGGGVTNTGTIDAGAEGVELGDGATVANGLFGDRGGVIRGGSTGIRVGEDAEIDSLGLVQGGAGPAIRAGSGLRLNVLGGLIEGGGAGADGVVIDGSGAVYVDDAAIEAEGVAVRASRAVSVFLGIGGTVAGGEAGIVGGDGSSVGTSESGSAVFARGDAVRLGRGTSIGGDGGIVSTGSGDAVSVIDGSVAAVDPEGFISAARGAAVRARAPEPGTGPAGALTVRADEGTIVGAVGVRADEGNTAAQTVVARAGTVAGASGTAVDLGAGEDAVVGRFGGLFEGDVLLGAGDDIVTLEATGGRIDGDVLFGPGDDTLTLASGTTITGDTLFGPGDDVLRYERSMFDRVADAFGLFAGGAGFDEAVFEGFGLGELDASPVVGGFDLLFEDGASRLSATLTGFERVRLDDVTLSFPGSPTPAPIPLPAALPLLAAALGGLAMLRRRGRGPDPRPAA